MIDLDAVVAIDVHTDVQASQDGSSFPEDPPEAAVAKVFGSDALLTVPELAAYQQGVGVTPPGGAAGRPRAR